MLKDTYILGIETSCDETSAAVVKNGREVLSNIINSQIKIHEQYGGVVPEIASRCHIEAIHHVVQKALEEAGMQLKDIDAIGCTYGPGLVGALLVGVSYAKALSYATGKPLIAVNHIQGHIAANYITHPKLEPPFLCLIISGGHTHLVHIQDYAKFEILGKTRDDAIGEAFDKVARVVGLGYPGGPKVDKLAKEGVPNISLPKTHLENLDFSFSGIKTAIINLMYHHPDTNKADLCASFEKDVTEILIENTLKAAKMLKIKTVALAGGVSANSYIRSEFEKLKQRDFNIYYPEMVLCTDNAAMIAAARILSFPKCYICRFKTKCNTKSKIIEIGVKTMSIFAIADLHLSFGNNKPMDVFGANWEGHFKKIKEDWKQKVSKEDTVLLPGDFSWATYLDDTYKDFSYLTNLPGKKLLLKGNHDYWWTTLTSMRNFLQQNNFQNIDFIYNNSYEVR